jgi:ABC-type uncharacterized transport system ATPase subunit
MHWSQSEVRIIYAVELENISKTFPGGVEAKKNITLRIEKGEVHGLLGENGAGKSTAMNILYGLLAPTSGNIKINGELVHLHSPEDAISKGVGMVHQHFKLIQPLTVVENVMMGYESPGRKLSRSALIVTALVALFTIAMFYMFLSFLTATVVTISFILIVILLNRSYEILTYLLMKLHPSTRRTGILGFISRGLTRIISELRFVVFNFVPLGIAGAAERINKIADENGLDIDPYARILDISVGLQQRVEIIKVLYREAEILILDEPTSVLTPQEVDELFVTLERFRESGKTIILITHKLREPMALCDRITVLRDGVLVGTVRREDTSPQELARMMVGRPVVFTVEKGAATPGEVVLSVQDLQASDTRGLQKVNGITFDIRAGEIFGIAGVEGNGQTELVEVITGLLKPTGGTISVNGKDVTGKSPRRMREAGIAHIPEDRHKRGLVLPFSIAENLALGSHYRQPYATAWHGFKGFLNLNQFKKHASQLVSEYSIKVGKLSDSAGTLSGGNQQKLVVARELSSSPVVLVAAQPTRGLDVGATEYIHNVLIKMRDAGVGVLLVSAELDEIQTLSNRIGVIFDGKIVAIKDPSQTTAEELGLLMAGHNAEEEVTA